MLDDDTGRRREALHALPSGIGVCNVVVRELFALQLTRCHQRAGRRMQVTVKSGLLVRVLAVAQILQFDEAAIRLPWEQLPHRGLAIFGQVKGRQIATDGAVVLADAVEGCHGQRKPGFFRQMPGGLQLRQRCGVLGGVGQHAHIFPVLGATAHHGGAANVNVLDSIVQAATGPGYSGLKGVEVDHQQVNGVNAMRGQRCHVFGHLTAGEQTAVHCGVQGFDAAVQHLGETREFGHFGHWQAVRGQQLGGATGGNQPDAQGVQGLREGQQASFVGDREESVHLFDQLVLKQLLAQRVAVEPQPLGGTGLVVVGVLHDNFKQWPLHHAHQHVVHAVWLGTLQVPEINLQAAAHTVLNHLLAHAVVSRCGSRLGRSTARAAGSRSICWLRRSK